jgi:tripartite-type tricarboxylate transporter receptor subunit TctC
MRRRTVLLGLAATAAAGAAPALAQSGWPAGPIRVLNGLAPGGATDIIMRTIAEDLRVILGQAVVIENKAGANGQIAMEEVIRAKPDGYTLFVGASTVASSAALRREKLGYDMDEKLSILSPIADGPPTLMCVTKEIPVTNFKELIEFGKANPGKLRYASSGAQTGPHLDMFYFGKKTGLQMVHLPQKGGGGIITALSNKDANIALINTAAIATQLKNGDVRAIATLTPKRLGILPDVPTLAELGHPDVGSGLWHVLYAPADTPAEIQDKLFDAIQKAMKSERMADLYKRTEAEPVPLKTRAESKAWLKANMERFHKLIAEVGAEAR